MKKYNVVIVGIGLVGQEMVKILLERNFPLKNLKILARYSRIEKINGKDYKVEKICNKAFDNVDIAFFAGTEGSKGASQLYGWQAVEKNVLVIDNGDDYRMNKKVPLVIPEVNPHHLKNHQGFIANPNCSTIQMVVALAPLHKEFKIKKIIVSTYQAVSGTGGLAIRELEEQIFNFTTQKSLVPKIYPHQIAFNLFPHISSLKDEFKGYYGEEIKMIKETRKIFDLPDMIISATCVRVPVFNGHCEAIHVEFEKELTTDMAKELLKNSKGIEILDEPEKNVYPTPLEVSGKNDVFVGRIRQNPSCPTCLDMWVAADNIRKGAALNAIQIAEKMIEMNLL